MSFTSPRTMGQLRFYSDEHPMPYRVRHRFSGFAKEKKRIFLAMILMRFNKPTVVRNSKPPTHNPRQALLA